MYSILRDALAPTLFRHLRRAPRRKRSANLHRVFVDNKVVRGSEREWKVKRNRQSALSSRFFTAFLPHLSPRYGLRLLDEDSVSSFPLLSHLSGQ